MARVQLHIRSVTANVTNAQADAIVAAVEALKAAVDDAGGDFGGTPDVTRDYDADQVSAPDAVV